MANKLFPIGQTPLNFFCHELHEFAQIQKYLKLILTNFLALVVISVIKRVQKFVLIRVIRGYFLSFF